MSQVSLPTEHSDSFGKSTGVRVHVDTKRAPLGSTGAVLSTLFFVPFAPLIGWILGFFISKRIENDATVLGAGKAKFAMWAGFACTAFQALIVSVFYYMVLISTQDAASVVRASAAQNLGTQEPATASVHPDFGLLEFIPGSKQPYRIETGGIERTVYVQFDTVPIWTSAGPMFGSSIIDDRTETAIHD